MPAQDEPSLNPFRAPRSAGREVAARKGLLVAASFFVTTVIGCAFLANWWWEAGLLQVVVRSTVFTLLMAVAHIGGYSLYTQQTPREPVLPRRSLKQAFAWAAIQQAALLLFSLLLLDGGALYRRVLVATIAFWAMVILGVCFRKDQHAYFDWLLVKYGIWPLVLLVALIAAIVGRY